MSYQKISTFISDLVGKGNPRSPLYPHSQNSMDFGILTTKKARDLLQQFQIDVNVFTGTPKITLQKNKNVLTYPSSIDRTNSMSQQNFELEKFVKIMLMDEELSIKLEVPSYGGIFKWLPKDEMLLLITVYKLDPSRARFNKAPKSPYSIKCRHVERNDTSFQPYGRQIARLLFYIFLEYKKQQRENFDSSYKKFLDHYFQPYEDFLYHERLAIRDPKYRPKCKFTKRIMENERGDDRVFLEVEDPPRQITEAGNSVVPASNGSKQKFASARITDYDEFNSLLIFEEGYKLKDWPDEGTLLLEGDMASNRRKTNAIRKIKSRGIQPLAKLADVLMRPWGLPEVISVPRTYFNEGISHDSKESRPQAKSIDIALSSNDVTLIHGPPGTGKTTVIVEIIKHVISNGGRVIMCAPTHVAVDNVLERLMGSKGVSAVRVGGTAYMDEELLKFRLSDKTKSFENALPTFSLSKKKKSPLKKIQDQYKSKMESKGKFYLEKLAIDQSNLVCGTTIGIARFEPPTDNPIDFDVMIIDEASKTTVMEFLVPAVRAKKWILVGDHRQLPPYVNEQEIRIYVQRYFEKLSENKTDDKPHRNQKNTDDQTIYDDKTNQLIASLRRYHEEIHALGEGIVDAHWKRIQELFEYSKKPILSIEEMVNFALGSCFHYFLQRLDESRNARLIVQHRMPSILADFLDKEIYKGLLKTSKTASTHGINLPSIPQLAIEEISTPLTFLSTERLQNNEENPGRYKGYYNRCEAEVITNLISEFIKLDVKSLGYDNNHPLTIGVITYYAGQSREINRVMRQIRELEKERGWRYKVPNKPIKIRVSIVDRFQGQEQDIVILSLTRSNKIGNIGFLKNLQRVNVSLSRAKQNLIVVGNARFFAKSRGTPPPILRQLAKYAIKNKLVKYAMEDYEE